jgi:hypothetical protein
MIFLTVNDLWNKILKVGHQVTNHPVYGWTLKSLHFFYFVCIKRIVQYAMQ